MTRDQRIEAVKRRSVKGAIHVKSMEGRGVQHPDARELAREACARALSVALLTKEDNDAR